MAHKVGNGNDNTLTGTADGDLLEGLGGSDTLIGLGRGDRLIGSTGRDLLNGGAGADVLDGGGDVDTASYLTASAPVTVSLIAPGINTGEADGDIYISIEGLIGSVFGDFLTGNSAGNRIQGGGGNDILSGSTGVDQLEGGTGDDRLLGGPDNDNLILGDAGDDQLFGNAGNDGLTGGTGSDILEGGLGADFLNGQGGNDTASYSGAAGVNGIGVTVILLNPALNTGEAAGDAYSSIENLTGSAFNDFLAGTLATNTIIGGSGNDTAFGNNGNDLLLGGLGNDTLDGGNDNDRLDGESGNDTLNAKAGNDRLIGGGGNDKLNGGDGADKLDGGIGADALSGGDGIDTATYAEATAGVGARLADIAANSGDAAGDTYSSVENLTGSRHDDTLGGNSAANRMIGGIGTDLLFGNQGDDDLFGTDGADTLEGGEGGDHLAGGTGIDAASYILAAGSVSADLEIPGTNTGDAAGDDYVSIEDLEGSDFKDILAGNAGINRIVGGFGDDSLFGRNGDDDLFGGFDNDTLEGGIGADDLVGGDGFDTASYAAAAVGVRAELGNAAANTGDAAGDTYLLIENLTGSAHDDVLVGKDSANKLDGGRGGDTMQGGVGNDVYVVDNAADIADESVAGSSGIDRVEASVSFSLANVAQAKGTIENLTLTGSADLNGTGNAAINLIVGNGGDNTLDGGGDNDTMRGGAGNDSYVVAEAGDIVDETGGTGTDSVSSSVTFNLSNLGQALGTIENLTLTGPADVNGVGNAAVNVIVGNGGNNILNGRLDNDTLTGAGGIDRFLFNTTPGTTTNFDAITDFSVNVDEIALDEDVFVGIGTVTPGRFHLGGVAVTAGQRIMYNPNNGNLFYDQDGTGAIERVRFATLDANLGLDNEDFVIVG